MPGIEGCYMIGSVYYDIVALETRPGERDKSTHTELYEKPEWLLAASLPRDNPADVHRHRGLLHDPRPLASPGFGNPDAHAWAVERFSGLVKNSSLAVYHQDSNIDPLFYRWTGEAVSRQGMTETKYVTGSCGRPSWSLSRWTKLFFLLCIHLPDKSAAVL
jgi:hypothetical protein